MQLNRTLVLTLASVVVGYAQQTPPTQLQPSNAAPPPTAPQPVKKPVAAKPKPQAQPGNAAAAQPQQAQQQPTAFDEHARQGNITTCANVFGKLGRGLATNSTFTAQSQWGAKPATAHGVRSRASAARGIVWRGHPGTGHAKLRKLPGRCRRARKAQCPDRRARRSGDNDL